MTDPEPLEREAAPPPAAPEGEAAEPAGPLDARSVAALRRSAFHASLGLALYTVVALGLLAWSLRRGRLSDALLLLVAMLVALPPIVSYRAQLRRRLQAITAGGGTGEGTTTEGIAGEEVDSGDRGGDPPSPAAET